MDYDELKKATANKVGTQKREKREKQQISNGLNKTIIKIERKEKKRKKVIP